MHVCCIYVRMNNFRDYLNEIIRYKIRAIDIPLGISYIYPVP